MFQQITNFGRNFGWMTNFGLTETEKESEYSVSSYKKGNFRFENSVPFSVSYNPISFAPMLCLQMQPINDGWTRNELFKTN